MNLNEILEEYVSCEWSIGIDDEESCKEKNKQLRHYVKQDIINWAISKLSKKKM